MRLWQEKNRWTRDANQRITRANRPISKLSNKRKVKNEVEELREEVAELKAATPAKIEEPEVLKEETEEIEEIED